MIVFESNYLAVDLTEDKKILTGVWRNIDFKFTTDSFKENMLAWFEEAKKIGNINILADAREFTFTIDIDNQSWINKNVIGKYSEYGVKKLGFLVSPDIFAQVSIEQTIEEEEQTFEVCYFEDGQEAVEWLAIS